MKTTYPVKIVLVEDQAHAQLRFARLLGADSRFALLATFGSVDQALGGMTDLNPDVVLMDNRFPGTSGIEGLRRLKRRTPGVLVLMVTQFDDSDLLFDALKAGADGYLLKNDSDAQLRVGILEVFAGGAPMSRPMARRVLAYFRSQERNLNCGPAAPAVNPQSEVMSLLTPREYEVLAELASGASCKQIAHKLGVQESTVRVHLTSVYRKLNVSSGPGAVGRFLGQRPAVSS